MRSSGSVGAASGNGCRYPEERQNGSICLNFSSGAVTVPVSGTSVAVIQSVPERITVSSGSAEQVERQAVLSSSDGREFKIVSAELTGTEGTVEVTPLRPDRWQCRVSILPASITPGAVLRIQTSCEEQPDASLSVETVD